MMQQLWCRSIQTHQRAVGVRAPASSQVNSLHLLEIDRYSFASYVSLDRRSEWPWLLSNDPSSGSTNRRFNEE